MKKAALGVAISAGVLLLIVAVGYLALAGLVPKFGEAMFRETYEPVQPTYTVLSDSQLALAFGGSCGLARLSRLHADPAMSPVGKKRAAEMILYIRSGRHVTDLQREIKEILASGRSFPPAYRYAQFVIWHDRSLVTK